MKIASTRVLFAALCTAALLCGAAPLARAQSKNAAAQKLFDEGVKLMDQGKVADACAKLEASLKLDKTTGTLGALAICDEQVGKIATAWNLFREVSDTDSDPAKKEFARKHADDLESRLPNLTIAVTAAATGQIVKLDGEVVDPVQFGNALPIDPGKHHIEAAAPGHNGWDLDFSINESGQQTIDIPQLDISAVVPVGPTDTVKPSKGRKYIGIGLTAAGGVAVVVGVVFGASALSARDDARKAGCHDDLTQCPAGMALDSANKAYDNANIATYATIGGVVLIGAGVITWLTAPKAGPATENAPPPSPTAIRFVPEVGPGQVGFSLTGGF